MNDFICEFCNSKIYIHADGTALCSCDERVLDDATTYQDLPDKWDQYQTKHEILDAMIKASKYTDL